MRNTTENDTNLVIQCTKFCKHYDEAELTRSFKNMAYVTLKRERDLCNSLYIACLY